MSKYPALTAMGINNPKEIERFALYMADNTDIIRIVYNRKKGSILPVSKKFKFPRLKKSTLVDSGTRQTEVLFESSQEFRNAVAELEALIDIKHSADELRKLVEDEVRAMEEEVASRSDYIRSLLDKL